MKRKRLLWLWVVGGAVLGLTAAVWIVWNDALVDSRRLELTIPPDAALDPDNPHGIPLEIYVRVGDVVVLTNNDSVVHRVGGLSVSPGSTASQPFRSAGVMESTCTVHPTDDVTYFIAPLPTFNSLWGIEVGLFGLIVAASLIAAGSWAAPLKFTLLATGVALAATGAGIYIAALPGDPASEGQSVNPIPPDETSLAAGEAVYRRFCECCHGQTGVGDGPVASSTPTPTADLNLHIEIHPDDYLMATINTGIPAVNMPALERTLSEEDKWRLINYLREYFSDTEP